MALAWMFFVVLQLKHFVVDFPLQVPFMYKNKGTYGHVGGISHAALHGIAMFNVIWVFGWPEWAALWMGLIDFTVHYHIDWAKMKINKATGWGPLTSEKFWWLLGFDQLLHQLTYIWIVWWLVS